MDSCIKPQQMNELTLGSEIIKQNSKELNEWSNEDKKWKNRVMLHHCRIRNENVKSKSKV